MRKTGKLFSQNPKEEIRLSRQTRNVGLAEQYAARMEVPDLLKNLAPLVCGNGQSGKDGLEVKQTLFFESGAGLRLDDVFLGDEEQGDEWNDCHCCCCHQKGVIGALFTREIRQPDLERSDAV